MVVGYSDNGVLVLGLTQQDVEHTLQIGKTLTFEGQRFLMTDVIVMWGRDRAHLVEQLRAGGVEVSMEWEQHILEDRGRTDKPRKPF